MESYVTDLGWPSYQVVRWISRYDSLPGPLGKTLYVCEQCGAYRWEQVDQTFWIDHRHTQQGEFRFEHFRRDSWSDSWPVVVEH